MLWRGYNAELRVSLLVRKNFVREQECRGMKGLSASPMKEEVKLARIRYMRRRLCNTVNYASHARARFMRMTVFEMSLLTVATEPRDNRAVGT